MGSKMTNVLRPSFRLEGMSALARTTSSTFLLASLIACSTDGVVSSHVPKATMSVSGTSGIYYLPKALLHIKLERTETFSICERKRSKDGKEVDIDRSEEHTSELQSIMRISYAVFCLKKKK